MLFDVSSFDGSVVEHLASMRGNRRSIPPRSKNIFIIESSLISLGNSQLQVITLRQPVLLAVQVYSKCMFTLFYQNHFLNQYSYFLNNESNIGKIIKLLVSQAIFCLLTLESFEQEESILERVAYQV